MLSTWCRNASVVSAGPKTRSLHQRRPGGLRGEGPVPPYPPILAAMPPVAANRRRAGPATGASTRGADVVGGSSLGQLARSRPGRPPATGLVPSGSRRTTSDPGRRPATAGDGPTREHRAATLAARAVRRETWASFAWSKSNCGWPCVPGAAVGKTIWPRCPHQTSPHPCRPSCKCKTARCTSANLSGPGDTLTHVQAWVDVPASSATKPLTFAARCTAASTADASSGQLQLQGTWSFPELARVRRAGGRHSSHSRLLSPPFVAIRRAAVSAVPVCGRVGQRPAAIAISSHGTVAD